MSAPFVRLRIVGHGSGEGSGGGLMPVMPSMTNVEVIDQEGNVLGQLRATDWWAHGKPEEPARCGFAIFATDVEVESR